MKTEIITEEVKTLAKEMAAWCIDSHTENFMCDFHFTAHVDWVEVTLSSGGHNSGGEIFKPDFISLKNDWSLKWLTEAFDGMKEFKAWHDEEFKPENIEKAQEKAKQDKIKSLKKQLLQLENKVGQ